MNLNNLQRLLPHWLRVRVKRHYRTFFPNKLIVIFSPTLRCNYSCSYCPIHTTYDYAVRYGKDCERTSEQWIAAFERLPPALVIVTGGEPMLFRGISDLVDGMPAKHTIITVNTNLSATAAAYLNIQRPIRLSASLHREFCTMEKFAGRIAELSGRFQITVNLVATPQNLAAYEEIRAFFSRRKIPLHLDPLIDPDSCPDDKYRKSLRRYLQADRSSRRTIRLKECATKTCSAGRNYIALLPNGDVFACSGGMNYLCNPRRKQIAAGHDTSQFRLPNLFSEDFRLNAVNLICDLPCPDACDYDSAVIRF